MTTITSEPPVSAEDRKQLKTALTAIAASFGRIDMEREAMKEDIEAVEKKYNISKKIVRKIASTMNKHNYATIREEQDSFETIYETLIEGKQT